MKIQIALLFVLTACSSHPSRPDRATSETLAQISNEIVSHGQAYQDLKELTEMGPRLCGSGGEANAAQWAMKKLKAYGADKVWLQPVTVPHWVRGEIERARIVGTKAELKVTSLGLAQGTGKKAIVAEVVEVKSIDEVKSLGNKLKGKIVFYNRPMDPSLQNTFEAYGKAGDQRNHGPAIAAQFGAKAVLVRSLTTLPDDDHPHTGATHYKSDEIQVPAAALSTHAANVLSQKLTADPHLKLKLELSGKILAPATTNNVVAEITGHQLPNEFVVVGGHIDSWDLATGAMDDGAGVVQAIEVLRTFRVLGLKPRRSVRVVLFSCEEIGGLGGDEYAKVATLKAEKHVMALESDNGGFSPIGFRIMGDDLEYKKIQGWPSYLKAFHADKMTFGDSDTDVEPLTKNKNGMSAGLQVVPDLYFNYHHSALDIYDNIPREDLLAGASAMAAFIYLSSERL